MFADSSDAHVSFLFHFSFLKYTSPINKSFSNISRFHGVIMYRTAKLNFSVPLRRTQREPAVLGIIKHNTVHVETRGMVGDCSFSNTLKCPLSPD